ncbi:ABC transporter permease [Sphingorhabdus contaminans]|uniref:FtsX-like permease family protein n=1 Tax=Sphingorhabdus contaminans TaxID=1343899 RepID=A0A553WK26_9SPHN|nr:FtsX-like permease family protein [Sphingorhabdus contaminans]TSB05018.1 FtsX-like permease family protein [Sphingorhabdus contaminans]
MSLSLAAIWRISRRDLSTRIRGLRLLAICLFLGVATLAAIGSLTAGISEELSRRGQTILGGDVEIGIAQRQATADELAAMRKVGAVSETVRLRAMAIGEDSLLAELKAVDGLYPHYGKLRLAGNGTAKTPEKGEIYIGPTLSDRLDIKQNETVRFGEAMFKVAGIIAEEPDRLGEGFTLGPVAIINMASLPDTKLIQPGSMYEAKYRIKLPPQQDATAIAKSLEAQFPSAGWEITDRSNGAPGTRRFIERMGQFLTLVGLAALVIAGIGVGNGVGSYLASKRASIATLKVNGADSGIIFRIYMLQILAVSIAAIFVGLAVGSVMPLAIGWVAGDILPVAPGYTLHPLPLAVSALYGLLIAIAFALPPLARARTVPAAGLFRSLVEGDSRIDRRSLVWVIGAIIAIIAIAVGTAREPLFSLAFVGAAFGLLLLLTGIAWLLRFIVVRLPRPKAPLPRLALANLHRPGAQTQALVVALGLGLTLFVTLATIQTSIGNEIKNSIPERAPSFFILDIPRDGAERFTDMVKDADPKANVNMIPALRGTIVEFGGQRVDQLKELPEGAWVLNGDRGLTYSAELPKGSEVVAGTWWPKDYKGPPLISLEAEVAATLGLKVGDSMTVSLLGVEVPAKIASLRTVKWDNFGLNYVIVFSPGSLDSAPHNMVATVTVSKPAEAVLAKALPPAFPSASLIEVGEVTAQITTLLSQMAQAIAAAASIAILAGIAVLVGAIAAARQSRIYDSVIMKLLGSSRGQILGAQAMEYGILALVLGVLSLGLGMAAGWYVVVEIFDFSFAPDPLILAITLVGGAGITFILGIVGSLPILAARPAEALRSL